MIVHKLTKENHPGDGARVWLWRDDSKRWVIETMSRSITQYLGNPALAYTHWAHVEEPPRPSTCTYIECAAFGKTSCEDCR